jgi:hypothetical protein
MGVGTTVTLLLPAYSQGLALRESFLDVALDQVVAPGEKLPMGLIAIESVSGFPTESPERRQELARLSEDVRRRLHQGDLVLSMEPSWVVVMAATDAQGIRAIVHRLQETLPQGERLLFGMALYPADGEDGVTLFEHARRALGQERLCQGQRH